MQNTIDALMEISSGKEKAIGILAKGIYNKSIPIVDATKAAKEISYLHCEFMAIYIIADAFNTMKG